VDGVGLMDRDAARTAPAEPRIPTIPTSIAAVAWVLIIVCKTLFIIYLLLPLFHAASPWLAHSGDPAIRSVKPCFFRGLIRLPQNRSSCFRCIGRSTIFKYRSP